MKKYLIQLRGLIFFFAIGLIIYFLDISLIFFFSEILMLDITVTITLSYIIIVLVRFILDYKITFRVNNGNKLIIFFSYISVVIINYVLTLLIVHLSLIFITNNIIIAKSIAVFGTFFIGYYGMKKLVFK